MIVAKKTLGDNFDIIVVDHDPTSISTAACAGCLIIEKAAIPKWHLKLTDGDDTNVALVIRHDNLAGALAPGINDDSGAGYTKGSDWLNAVTGKWYKCRSAATGAAVWDILN